MYGKVLGDDGIPRAFTEVIARLNGSSEEKNGEGEDVFPIIARSELVDDPDAGEIYALRIPRDDAKGIEDTERFAAVPGDVIFILVDGEVVKETQVNGIEVTGGISDVTSMNLNGEDCEDLADCDKDGLKDVVEQQIIDADPNDAFETLEDVLPDDDFDLDGFSNLVIWPDSSDFYY